DITRYCYDDNPDWCDLYGGLYTWNTVMQGQSSSNSNPSGVQGICPDGWHVPSDAEWTELTNYLINNYDDFTSSNVGNKLKSCRQVDSPLGGCNTSDHPRWNSNDSHFGTDDFDFSALPGGYRNPSGGFYFLGAVGYWWSSTEYSSSHAWFRRMSRFDGSVGRGNSNNKTYGFGLRCVRDLD
ncbi:MAG: fibrobacter succinogenes major paralogous domain-containing protein, partial [Bacteroidales bacterium]